MRLKVSRAMAEELLTPLIVEGHRLFLWVSQDYCSKLDQARYNSDTDFGAYMAAYSDWHNRVTDALGLIFPTDLEASTFAHTPAQPIWLARGLQGQDMNVAKLAGKLQQQPEALRSIMSTDLSRYTDLPLKTRIYLKDIDSFVKVRDVDPGEVLPLLTNGRLDLAEDVVQQALETILKVPVHKKDWGGETNDLYTSNVVVSGASRATAFLLKGNGLKASTMELKHCGTNGDQVLRLFQSPSDLFVIQFIGNISEAIIKDAEGKTNELRAQGKNANYCIVDGQETARLLVAYGHLSLPE